MKRIFFMLLCAVVIVPLWAQDVIYLKSGEEIKANVKEIDQTSVRYLPYGQSIASMCTHKKSDILLIVYANGQRETFAAEQSENKKEERVWVDLGLVSGTLWASKPEEGYYTYDEAKETFGKNMPTKWQWEELNNSCQVEHIYTKETKGYLYTGINGNSIFIPEHGYWTFTTPGYDTKHAYYTSDGETFYADKRKRELSVVLINK